MQRAGFRARHRAPARAHHHRPMFDLFQDGILLAVVFGITLAACQEAYLDRDWPWLIFFAAAATGCLTLYTLTTRSLLRWLE